MNITQRIGWDPLARQIRSWVFDSEGGYADGYWTREETGWSAQLRGVLNNGKTASMTNIWTPVDDTSVRFQSTNRRVEGEPLPDTDLKLVKSNGG
jgi:hypothetical protein